MSIQDIQTAIKDLSQSDLAQFATWFADFQMEQWDDQIAQDLKDGKLDGMIKEARAEYQAGNYSRI